MEKFSIIILKKLEFEECKESSLEPKVKVSWKREYKVKKNRDGKEIGFREKQKKTEEKRDSR